MEVKCAEYLLMFSVSDIGLTRCSLSIFPGLYTYTPMDWLEYVYPKLKPADKPLECIQNAGEIFYVVGMLTKPKTT